MKINLPSNHTGYNRYPEFVSGFNRASEPVQNLKQIQDNSNVAPSNYMHYTKGIENTKRITGY